MEIRYKLYPYPVLASFSDDYSNAKDAYKTTIEILKDGYNYRVCFQSELSDKGLLQLIRDGKAQYVYHLECSQTGFRKVVRVSSDSAEIPLSNKKVRGKLQICPFVVATDSIQNYSNSSFDDDFAGMSFDIEAGCVLAVGNQVNANIETELHDLENTPSVFSITKNMDLSETHMTVSLDQSRIIIKLAAEDYNNYKSLNLNEGSKQVLNSLVIIPALIYALEEVKSRDVSERYELDEYSWYKAIKKSLLTKFHCDIESDEFNGQNMMMLAQKLINEPLSDALNMLASNQATDYGGGDEE